MGNKIITEKDFWMCTNGAVPAQFQSTQLVSNKKSGEKYITIRDKSTSSFIDFGCTKYMLLMALAAAALVVAAVVVGIITVATGGLGLIAIGALAGLAGGVLGAVVGSLLCGQKMASKRVWIAPKTNFKILEADTITGNCTMTCPAGGVVKFAPNIKSWTQAIGLASLNYVTKLAECALGGAMIGAAAPSIAGLFTGSATLALPTVASVASNIGFTFTGFGGLMGAGRSLSGADSVANEYAYGNINSAGDAVQTGLFGAIPEASIAYRVATTGQVHPSDALLLLYLLNIKAKAPAPEVKPDEKASTDDEGGKPDEGKQPPPTTEAEIKEPEPGKDGEAYEDPIPGNQELVDAVEAEAAKKIEAKKEAVAKGKNTPKLSPCQSGVQDMVTGEIFFNENFPKTAEGQKAYEQFKENASDLIKERIEARDKLINERIANGETIDPKHDPRLGGHSEVRALDDAIKAREAATGEKVTADDLKDFDLVNRHMPSNTPMDRCSNCADITKGVNVVGGHN